MTKDWRTLFQRQTSTLIVGSIYALVITILLLICAKSFLPTYITVIAKALLPIQMGFSVIYFFYPLGSILIPPHKKNQSSEHEKEGNSVY
jgi:K+-transporting ATPase c subunit